MPAKGKGYQALTPRLQHLGGSVNVPIWLCSLRRKRKNNFSREKNISGLGGLSGLEGCWLSLMN